MATLGALALTYADWARRVDDDGKIAKIIEILSQTNEVVYDALVVEGNSATGHKTTIRTGLPQGTWRQLYQGVAQAKSTTAQVTDSFGMLEAYSIIDRALAELNGDLGAFRLSEDLAFLEGLNQQMAAGIFYGNAQANPERFNGLAIRYNTVNTSNAANAQNVIDAGGTGSTNTSIWTVTWGPNTCHMFFPKGQQGGLKHEDLGVRPAYDASNRPYEAYWAHYKWDTGLSLRDWRYVVRICNIDVTTLSGGSPPNLINALIRAAHRLPTAPVTVSTEQRTDAADDKITMGNTAIYANRTVRTWLDIQALDKTNLLLRLDEWHGKPITTFRGIPIRTCDAILSTEARVV